MPVRISKRTPLTFAEFASAFSVVTQIADVLPAPGQKRRGARDG